MIVGMHYGKISAKNIENGVAFTVQIPLGNKHLSTEEISKPEKQNDLYTGIKTE